MAHATNCVLPTTGTEKFRDEIQKNTARNIEQKGKLKKKLRYYKIVLLSM